MDVNLIDLLEKTFSKSDAEMPRNYIGASSIGEDCKRKIWYQCHGIQPDKIELRKGLIFKSGHTIENMLVSLLRECDDLIVETPRTTFSDSELPYFKGHIDVLITYNGQQYVVDIKTSNNSSFNQFKKNGLKSWNESYFSQLQAYMGMMGVNKAILLAINKDNSELHQEQVDFNEIYYASLVEKARAIYDSGLPPERINRSPLFFKCQFCSWKKTCHNL